MSEDLNTLIADYLAKRREDDERLRAKIATQRHELEWKRRELLEALLGKALKEHWDTFTSGECRLEWGSMWGKVRNENDQLVEIDEPIAYIVDTVTDARARFMLDDAGTNLQLRCRGEGAGYRYGDYRRPLVIYFAEEREKAELTRKRDADMASAEQEKRTVWRKRVLAEDAENRPKVEEALARLAWEWPKGHELWLYRVCWFDWRPDIEAMPIFSYTLTEPEVGRWVPSWRDGETVALLFSNSMVVERLTLRSVSDVPEELLVVPEVRMDGIFRDSVVNDDGTDTEVYASNPVSYMLLHGSKRPIEWLMRAVDPPATENTWA